MARPAGSTSTRFLPRGLRILFEDNALFVVEKPAGLLTQATEFEDQKTVHWALSDYMRKGQSKSRLQCYLVHRLDRDTSGVLVVAKTEALRERMQERWTETRKVYVAIVQGVVNPPEGTISSYLLENEHGKVRSTANRDLGKLAHTQYRVSEQTPTLARVDIDLLTGRKHQIRVHFAEQGNPVVGDPLYGPKDGPKFARLGLHAHTLEFPHPVTDAPMRFEAPIPTFFGQVMASARKAAHFRRPTPD
jgi:RluA family pseudouridine synthase